MDWLTNRLLTEAPNRSLVRSAGGDSQDTNLVVSLDKFAKKADFRAIRF